MKKTSIFKRVFSIVSYVLLAFVFSFLVFKFIRVYFYNDSSIFGYNLYNVVSDSMDPTYPVGSVIIDKKYDDYKDLEIGTVITFTDPKLSNYPNTHRIVGYYYQYKQNGEYVKDSVVCYENGSYIDFSLNSKEIYIKNTDDFYKVKNDSEKKTFEIIGYITKGDNPKYGLDEPRLYSQVIGVTIKKLYVVSFFYKIFKSIYGFIFLILVPLVSLLVLQIVSIAKTKSLEESKKKIEENEKEIEDITERLKKEAIEEYLNSKEKND